MRLLGFCWHRWTAWSEPFKEGPYPEYSAFEWQQRRCEKCGKVAERLV